MRVRLSQTLFYTVFVALLFAAPACGGSSARPDSFESPVAEAFFKAEEALEDSNYLEAIRRYNAIRNQFPFSRYAALSDLRLGDAYFEQEKFATAVEQYRGFVKLHPNHDRVVYANYRIALAFVGQMPDDWFIMPPAHEKDLAKARDAERELRFFLKRFPDSEFDKDAKLSLAKVRRRLADHEFYVATFYLDRGNSRAAAVRLTHLLKTYPGLGLDPPALFLLARSYIELKDLAKARRALDDLVRVHPNHKLSGQAREYLARLKPAAK